LSDDGLAGPWLPPTSNTEPRVSSPRRSHMWRLALIVLTPVVALVGCTSSEPSPGGGSPTQTEAQSSVTSAPPATKVTLDVGHCWVGYLHTDGGAWALTDKQQFGWDGGMPQTFRGEGQVTRISDSKLLYVDASGHRLVFIPVDSPKAFTTEGLACY